MKSPLKLMMLLVAAPLIISTGCNKTDHHEEAKQITGIGYLDSKDGCNSASQGADFALVMTGDLKGCMFTYIDEYTCSDGNYVEKGREYFVGTYKGKKGTFRTTYDFQAKFEGCNPDGTYAGDEISGQCQHPLVDGSGTGVFKGATGRYDMIDRVDATPIDYPYLGYIKF